MRKKLNKNKEFKSLIRVVSDMQVLSYYISHSFAHHIVLIRRIFIFKGRDKKIILQKNFQEKNHKKGISFRNEEKKSAKICPENCIKNRKKLKNPDS